MYKKIMVPVDLTHADQLEKALKTAANLAKHFEATVMYVCVTASTPNPLGHNPQEVQQKLDAFAKEQAQAHGIEATGKALISHDPAIDLDDTLMKAIDDEGVDLVVMQSHVPNITDYVWPSNGGTIATHSDASVFVVR